LRTIDLRVSSDRVTVLDEAVLYGAIAVALIAAVAAAGLAGGSVQLALVGCSLITAGTLVSWRLRDRGWRGALAGVPLGLTAGAAYYLLLDVAEAQSASGSLLGRGEVGLTFALQMVMLPIGFSFALVQYDVMVFSLVPALAIFGLVGGQGETAVVGLCFALFLPAALVALGHGMLLSGVAAGGHRGERRWRLSRWRGRHWMALGSAIGVITVLAGVLFVPISFYVGKYRWQLLMQVATGGMGRAGWLPMMRRGGDREAAVFPIGRGPAVLTHAPVLTIWGEPATLWRGEVFDHYTGQAWLRSAPTGSAEAAGGAGPQPALPAPRLVSVDGRAALDLSGYFPPPPGVRLQTHLVRAEPRTAEVIYGPGQVERVSTPKPSALEALQMDANGALAAPNERWAEAQYYQVVSSPLVMARPHLAGQAPDLARQLSGAGPRPALPRESYLRIPFGARRVADLAREVAGGEPTPGRRLAALMAYLQQHCVYTLDAPATPVGEDAADYFLFHSKRGYCDLFATALALMGRAAGIPTRVVTGYAYGPDSEPAGQSGPGPRPPWPPEGMERGSPPPSAPRDLLPEAGGNPNPPYVVRESDAHAWVEAYLEPWGWVSVDPTPASGESPIPPLRRSLLRVRFIWQDHPVAAAPIAAAGIVGLVYLVLQFRRVRLHLPRWVGRQDARGMVLYAYEQVLALLRRRGQRCRPSQTPLEFLDALRALSHGESGAGATAAGRRRGSERLRLSLQAALPAISTLIDLCLVARYSGRPVTDEEVVSARRQLSEARRRLRRRRA
jgi:hypothetical protein